ncbi:hypothetical protein [Nitratireductor sp. GCM10026969]|uniref:hypothetical protein n=1 Tax=Nitratireductor sp. GCM10026969 TaxID=3252645 RepID=UPI00361E127E
MVLTISFTMSAGAQESGRVDDKSSRINQEIRAIDREIEEIRARRIAREWISRFGIDPEADDILIELEVAIRQRKPFALVFNRCVNRHFSFEVDAKAFKECLEMQAEVERRLGNPLD